MSLHPRSLAFLVIANSLAFATPPALIAISASAPNAVGAQASMARYASDEVYVQLGLEQGLARYQSRWASISHGMLGAGLELESSSRLFVRATASYGIGYILNPGDSSDTSSDWMQVVRIAPQVVWYPYGRFSGTALGFTFGLNLEFRSSLTQQPLPGRLPGVNSQLVVGLVL
jgi:hypothetical protein